MKNGEFRCVGHLFFFREKEVAEDKSDFEKNMASMAENGNISTTIVQECTDGEGDACTCLPNLLPQAVQTQLVSGNRLFNDMNILSIVTTNGKVVSVVIKLKGELVENDSKQRLAVIENFMKMVNDPYLFAEVIEDYRQQIIEDLEEAGEFEILAAHNAVWESISQ